jgi:uncharacterized protein (TIGR03000 family)
MYSVVLATVLTAGGASPAWGHHGCHGCCGGYNAFSYSCGGCCGYSSCYGCCGGFTVSYSSCHGCYGGCYGSCYGSCYGCCGGCTGWSSGRATGSFTIVVPDLKIEIKEEKKGDKKGDKKDEKKGDKESDARSTQATVVVELPADAKMMIDAYESDLTSSSRTFVTPDLTPDRDYYYIIKAEVIRDGRRVSQSQKIFVRAGRTTRVEFGEMAETAARR